MYVKTYLKALIFAAAAAFAWYLSVFASEGIANSKVTDATMVTETVRYSDCTHIETKTTPADKSIVGLSAEDAARQLGYDLESFDKGKLRVTKTVPGFCDRHYIVRLEKDNIITVRIAKSGKEKLSYEVSEAQFSENDLKRLKKGIFANSEAELSSIIEDYTS